MTNFKLCHSPIDTSNKLSAIAGNLLSYGTIYCILVEPFSTTHLLVQILRLQFNGLFVYPCSTRFSRQFYETYVFFGNLALPQNMVFVSSRPVCYRYCLLTHMLIGVGSLILAELRTVIVCLWELIYCPDFKTTSHYFHIQCEG